MSRQGTKKHRTVKNVKDFWNKEASEWGENPRVTIRDHYFRLLEIEFVKRFIKNHRRALDIGCGSGFSSIYYAEQVETVIGADYAEVMVKSAKKFLTDPKYFSKVMNEYALEYKPELKGNLLFEVGNIVNIKYPNETFDTVISERVLINLPSEILQRKGIKEISRVLIKKGTCILVEVTKQGHEKMDEIRSLFGLEKLEKYWHNLYLNEPQFEDDLRKENLVIERVIRFETYQFLTKVMYPLIVSPKEPDFMSKFNNAARIISLDYPDYKSVKKIGINNFLRKVFRKILQEYDKSILEKYDEVSARVIAIDPNFSTCSHQVFYVLKKR